jgi:TRAP-type C4-dicarboxylate transport system permease small subunit
VEDKAYSGLRGRIVKSIVWVDTTILQTFLLFGSKVMTVFAGAILVSMMILVLIDIVVRRFSLHVPWGNNFEYVEISMAMLSFLTLAWCWYVGAHIRIEVLLDRLTAKAKGILCLIATFISLCCTGTLAWSLLRLGLKSIDRGTGSMLQDIPIGPFQIMFAIAMMHLSLVLTRSIWSYLAKACGRKFAPWSCDIRDTIGIY